MNRSLTSGITNVIKIFHRILPNNNQIRITNEVIPEYIPKRTNNYFLFSSKPSYNSSLRDETNKNKDENDDEDEENFNSELAAVIDVDLLNVDRKTDSEKPSKVEEKKIDLIHLYWMKKFYASTELIKESCIPLFYKNLIVKALDKCLKKIEDKNRKNLVKGNFGTKDTKKVVPYKRIKRSKLKELKKLKYDDYFKKILSFDFVFLMLMIKQPSFKKVDYQLEPLRNNCLTIIDHLSTFLRYYYNQSKLISYSYHKSDKIVRIDQLRAVNFIYDPIQCNQIFYAGIKINEDSIKSIQEFFSHNFLKDVEIYGMVMNFIENLSKFSLDNINIDYILFPIFILLTVFNIIWILYQQ
ncbi:uncharacterized protein [Onthophagus taurus]|uniref:uncharacterized protein n=1 Tax=Onthophagus taurus TaxID=166361 RepID=UPI0039BE4222